MDRVSEKRGVPESIKNRAPKPVAINDIPAQDGPRIPLNDRELSRVLVVASYRKYYTVVR